MKKPSLPTIGETGPRLPRPRPNNYQRVAVRYLRALPIRENPRLRILDYRLTDAPGMTSGKPRTHGHGAALLADGYVLALCITRIGGEWFLETERHCYDIEAAGRTDIALSAAQLADLYRGIQQKHMAAQGQAARRGAGRN